MERLPNETLDNAISVYKTTIKVVEENKDSDYCTTLDKATLALLEELKEYRDAEEQGLLLKLPCKVGDEVYCIKSVIDGCEICSNRVISYQTAPKEVGGILARGYMGVTLGIVGKNVFATKAEAEQALKQMKAGVK